MRRAKQSRHERDAPLRPVDQIPHFQITRDFIRDAPHRFIPKRMSTNRSNRVDEIITTMVDALPLMLTREETANLLRCQRNLVSELIEKGELVGFQRRARAGSPILIPRDSLRRYLERAAK